MTPHLVGNSQSEHLNFCPLMYTVRRRMSLKDTREKCEAALILSSLDMLMPIKTRMQMVTYSAGQSCWTPLQSVSLTTDLPSTTPSLRDSWSGGFPRHTVASRVKCGTVEPLRDGFIFAYGGVIYKITSFKPPMRQSHACDISVSGITRQAAITSVSTCRKLLADTDKRRMRRIPEYTLAATDISPEITVQVLPREYIVSVYIHKNIQDQCQHSRGLL